MDYKGQTHVFQAFSYSKDFIASFCENTRSIIFCCGVLDYMKSIKSKKKLPYTYTDMQMY